MTISIILPCYNPSDGWEQIVCSSYAAFCDRVGEQTELVLVLDGHSSAVTEESKTFIKQNIPALKLVEYPQNKGKGYAIRQGVAIATGDIIIYTDIDFPYSPDSLHTIYQTLRNNEADVAVGVKDPAYYAQVPAMRRAISKYLRVLIKTFLSMPITDTQCGLKGFKKEVAPLFLQTTIDRYLFDLEFVRNCFKSKNYRVKAIPVVLNEHVHFRKMNYSILLPEMLNFVKLLFKK
jgi:glycosyltransferase involved in cell wall biosynthesis